MAQSPEDKIPTIAEYTALKDPKARWALIKHLGYRGYGGIPTSDITGEILPYDPERDKGAVHNSKLKQLYAQILQAETNEDIRIAVEKRLDEDDKKFQLLRVSSNDSVLSSSDPCSSADLK